MKIEPGGSPRLSSPSPSGAAPKTVSSAGPLDGYAGTLPVSSVSFPRLLSKPQTSGLADTSASTALSASPGFWSGWLGKLKGLGLLVKDWVSGEARRHQEASETVSKVLQLEQKMRGMSDAELREQKEVFKARLNAGADLDDLQVEAFAVAREACRRATGLTPNDKQLLGAAYAHQGCVVDMKTGEGKTLMAALPAYLHALTGNGVHIITANDYLARRDCETLTPVFDRLGVTAAVVDRGLDLQQRKQANQADIVYGTAAEFGFQYLNDHLTPDGSERVSRDLSKVFALVDEADKVLLDEANTPLIISSSLPENPKPAQVMAAVVKHLVEESDFQTDKKHRQAWLTEAGLEKVEKILRVGDLYDPKNEELLSYLHQAVQARGLFRDGVDYMVQDGQVVLIDEFTGRPKPGHRFSEGLHQAIEARHGLVPGDGLLTMASVTFPNYLRQYGKLSGMTGTGLSAEREFAEIYGLNVRAVPTNRPVARKDLPDKLFETARERDLALADHIADLHRQGRPVLLGTRSIERSEELARLLTERGIPHQVLNARHLEAEADIIAQAGRLGAVTVATNMAGRGTDIKLGGDPALLPGDPQRNRSLCAQEKAQVQALGGLAVLGSERHEARRIDEQLAGRAGRQGDPGSSQFWLSKEDELFKIQLADTPVPDSQMVTVAQRKAEDRSLEGREYQLKYDGVVNLQREVVYAARDAVLDGDDVKQSLPDLVDRVVTDLSDRRRSGTLKDSEVSYALGGDDGAQIPASGFEKWLRGQLEHRLQEQQQRMGPAFSSLLAAVYVRSLDVEWMQQLMELDSLREGNRWEAGQEENPLQNYEKKAHEAFQSMLAGVALRSLHGILSARPIQNNQ